MVKNVSKQFEYKLFLLLICCIYLFIFTHITNIHSHKVQPTDYTNNQFKKKVLQTNYGKIFFKTYLKHLFLLQHRYWNRSSRGRHWRRCCTYNRGKPWFADTWSQSSNNWFLIRWRIPSWRRASILRLNIKFVFVFNVIKVYINILFTTRYRWSFLIKANNNIFLYY